jgi:23S rRNA (cytidine1920-2'-O)/16S rRNA (cytidine1409-2'-O)-methyltransferase
MNKEKKKRLDVFLTEKGLVETREQAKREIMAGKVRVDGRVVDKPAAAVGKEAFVELKEKFPFVSRGALKLAKALQEFKLNPAGLVCLDVGASTGGFTQYLLTKKARKVYAVDVGYGQLAWELRQDERVVVLERLNARYLTLEHLGEQVDLATIDVSFISLAKIFPAVFPLIKDNGPVVVLIKPQFEIGREKIGKGGVVRSRKGHCEVIRKVKEEVLKEGRLLTGLTFSPILGPKGNIEFLALLAKEGKEIETGRINEVVEDAHQTLLRREE